ncbi:MAG TPA: DUF5668 domain-containing protein, partial [Vicinamibacterales bacterium]|nr:DUF5668 domain-containing protein [Vicinamibacterales bacterium]
MDEQDLPTSRDRSTAPVVIGALLVAAGAALLIERLGAMPPQWRNGIWPVLLIGYGVAQLVIAPGQGRGGLFFALGGAWWLAGLSGWISFQRTWPLLFVALGVSIMYDSLTASGTGAGADRLGRRRRGPAHWLLIAILIGSVMTSGIGRRSLVQNESGDGVLHLYSVLGGSNSHVTATRL